MYIRSLFAHFSLVTRHRHAVFRNCVKCGIPFRGLLHDLSKFSPVEFFESVKYYTGKRSPIATCREKIGYSKAWLHHKGRNKHHMEYWQDDDSAEHPVIPYPYLVECMCDKIAATRVYKGKDYTSDAPLLHWQKYGSRVRANPKVLAFAERVFTDLAEHGDAYVLNRKYMKKTYREICLAKED